MINRPTRFNAFNDELYRAFPQALKEAGDDWPRTKVTLLTGNTASPWYSSGNDLTDFLARFKNASNMKQVKNYDVETFVAGTLRSSNNLSEIGLHYQLLKKRLQKKWVMYFKNLLLHLSTLDLAC